MCDNIFEIRDLNIRLREGREIFPAVEDFSLVLKRGTTMGIIGESGSGKSITCMAALGLLDQKKWDYDGRIFLNGEELPVHDRKRMRELRGSRIAMVLQNPVTAFNPLITIERHFLETIEAHNTFHACQTEERGKKYIFKKHMRREERQRNLSLAEEILRQMHFQNPRKVLESYPFQCSGGMLQRIMIAIAVLMEPELIICDEPTTALDRSIQHEIIYLLQELRERTGSSMILISHDLGMMEHLADEICVMYSGNLVERGRYEELRRDPRHPYTQGLFQSRPGYSKERLAVMDGNPPTLKGRGEGRRCHFMPRCVSRAEGCRDFFPGRDDGRAAHFTGCLLGAQDSTERGRRTE